MRTIKRIALTIFVTALSLTVQAQINFESSIQDAIDIETVEVGKKKFFDFVRTTIMNRKPGLGKYGRVSFHPCNMKIGELKLIDYRTVEGKEVRFLSNPSCHQIVIRRVLENGFQYNKTTITSYQNRQCLLSTEKIISPLLEYYTLKYEERKKGSCATCDFKEKERLNSILAIQKKILQHCQSESDQVMKFITELDTLIEATYKAKSAR